jgi:hypothetical protein
MRVAAALLMLAVSLNSLAVAQMRVLYDSRLPIPEPRLTENERGRIQYLAVQAATAGAWNYLDYAQFDYSQQCSGNDFRVNGRASGAFTTPKVGQIAYLYTYCWSSHADVLQGLIIVQGGKTVAHYTFHEDYYSLQAVKDINLNGKDELLLVGADTGQGYTEGWLNLIEFQQGVRFLGQLDYNHLPQPYADNCGVEGGTWKSVVLRVLPGRVPSYTQQDITGRCSNVKVATSAGPVRPLPLQTILVDWPSGPIR